MTAGIVLKYNARKNDMFLALFDVSPIEYGGE